MMQMVAMVLWVMLMVIVTVCDMGDGGDGMCILVIDDGGTRGRCCDDGRQVIKKLKFSKYRKQNGVTAPQVLLPNKRQLYVKIS